MRNTLDFLYSIRELQNVIRHTPKSIGGFENDAEHSWSVAISILVLHEDLEKEFHCSLDLKKMLSMALIHDLAEIKTGDTLTWEPETRINKEQKEREAMQELLGNISETLKDKLMSLWEEVERKESLEAKIVKSLDRLDPVIHRVKNSVGWNNTDDEVATIKHLDSRQLPRHEFSDVITKIYNLVRQDAIDRDYIK